MKLMDFLKLPEADKIQDINDALTPAIHKEILLTVPEGFLVELGSGSGFIKDIIPIFYSWDLNLMSCLIFFMTEITLYLLLIDMVN